MTKGGNTKDPTGEREQGRGEVEAKQGVQEQQSAHRHTKTHNSSAGKTEPPSRTLDHTQTKKL